MPVPSEHARTTLATELGERLLHLKQRVATVESCTGGGIAQQLTAIAGSSSWFERGFVTYSNDAKIEMLGVQPALLQNHGAVSVETARAMAEGGLRYSRADCCIAVTGVAGPDGGSAEKPVGTVCFAWAARARNSVATQVHFVGDRHAVRQQSLARALAGLLDLLAS